jgi:hypothetical protein
VRKEVQTVQSRQKTETFGGETSIIGVSFCWQYCDLNSGFAFAKQALYHLSHTSSLFCSGYFGDRVLLFAQAVLSPSILYFHCS